MKEEAMENVLLAIRPRPRRPGLSERGDAREVVSFSGDVTSLFEPLVMLVWARRKDQNERQTVYDRREDSHPAGGGRGQIDP